MKIGGKKMRFSSPGRDEFGLRAEWSGGVRAVRKSLLLAYQAWSRTRAQRSASQTRPSHRKRWSADLNAYAHSAGPETVVTRKGVLIPVTINVP